MAPWSWTGRWFPINEVEMPKWVRDKKTQAGKIINMNLSWDWRTHHLVFYKGTEKNSLFIKDDRNERIKDILQSLRCTLAPFRNHFTSSHPASYSHHQCSNQFTPRLWPASHWCDLTVPGLTPYMGFGFLPWALWTRKCRIPGTMHMQSVVWTSLPCGATLHQWRTEANGEMLPPVVVQGGKFWLEFHEAP